MIAGDERAAAERSDEEGTRCRSGASATSRRSWVGQAGRRGGDAGSISPADDAEEPWQAEVRRSLARDLLGRGAGGLGAPEVGGLEVGLDRRVVAEARLAPAVQVVAGDGA